MNFPASFLTALRAHRIVPFAGAGVSLQVKDENGNPLFPTWKGLLEEAARKLAHKPKYAKLISGSLEDPPDFLQAAKYAQDGFGAQWNDFLGEQFQKRVRRDQPGLKLAQAIWALGGNLVVTTNYDKVLQAACPDASARLVLPTNRESYRDLLTDLNQETIWHLHGHIEHKESLILTEASYANFYQTEGTPLFTLRSYLATKSLVFIGFDIEVAIREQIEWELRMFGGSAGPHFAVVQSAKRTDFENRLKDAKLEYIEFEQYDDLPALVEEMAKLRHGIARTHPVPSSTGAYDYATYRTKAKFTELWRPAGPTPPGRPVTVSLQDMYQELRLSPDNDQPGAPLTPAEVAALEGKRLILEGPAGSGKTTWMKHLFERLIADAPHGFPIFLELRALKPSGPLVETLETVFKERDYPWLGLSHALQQQYPRPILLVDGWDELGGAADSFRKQLHTFLTGHPHVTAIVTTRPTAPEKPSTYDQFSCLFFQLLNKDEQKSFTRNVWTRYYGAESDAESAYQSFLQSWEAVPEIQDLGANPMQLSMMLVIGRSEPLPDRRHRLYDRLFSHLLSRRDKAETGQWRPEDTKEREKAVAEMAFRMQAQRSSDYDKESHGIVLPAADMECLIPATISRKGEFLHWLVEQAGILRDRSDGSLQFAHLSYQDFAAARHLLFEMSPAAEIEKRAGEAHWWESLRLWAGLAQDDQTKSLDFVLPRLPVDLQGCIYADGAGPEAEFRSWAPKYSAVRSREMQREAWICASAWKLSRQRERMVHLVTALQSQADHSNLVEYFRLAEWTRQARNDRYADALTPRDANAIAMEALEQGPSSKEGLAFGRIWTFAHPVWPVFPVEAGLLNAWQSGRRVVGLQMQALALVGCDRAGMRTAAQAAVRTAARIDGQKERDLARDLAGDLARFLAVDLAGVWAGDWARDWARGLARYWARDWAGDWPPDLVREWARYWAWYWARYSVPYGPRNLAGDLARGWARDWARVLVQYGRLDWARDLARDWARDWGLAEPVATDFGSLLAFGANSVTFRAVLAGQPEESLQSLPPEVRLFSAASRQSLDNAPGLLPLAGITDPLWPALARHLSRQSTPDDRRLLIHLVQHPEERQPPLSWALKFIAGGTILLPGGEEVPLDDLVPGLPYLDEMEPELEIDWDAK